MKKLALTLLVCLFALAAVASADVPSSTLTADDLAVMQLLGFEPASWMLPAGNAMPSPSGVYLDCTRWNSSYCTYKYNKFDYCCKPIYVAPGAYCPWICI